MRIGIITAAHNAAPWIGNAIGSVLAQTHPNWVMSVVDDGSTDGTTSVVRQFSDPRIRLIRQARTGVSAARNRGAAQVGADAVLFLDADDWLAADALARLSQALDSDRRAVGACGPYAFVSDWRAHPRAEIAWRVFRHGRPPGPADRRPEDKLRPAIHELLSKDLGVGGQVVDARDKRGHDGKHIRGHFLHRLASGDSVSHGLEKVRPGRTRRPPSGDILERLLERNLFANGGHVLVRTEIMRAAGAFRPGLDYGEDWDFFVRVAMQGRFAAVPGRRPLLFVRRRTDGACLRFGTDPAAFRPCMDAVFGNMALSARLGPERLSELRTRREAENLWVAGQALLDSGRRREGRAGLRESFLAKPSVKRAALTLIAHLALTRPA